MVVNKDLPQTHVLFLHMIEVLGLDVEFGVDSFNPLLAVESEAHVPFS